MFTKNKRQGFTLIELLAVMAIIAILAAALVPQIPKFIDRANVTACRANMGELARNFELYKQRFGGDFPHESGIRFFLTLWRDDPNSHDDTYAKRFTCPGVKMSNMPSLRDVKPVDWFNDWDALDSSFTAYAGRDMDKYPKLDIKPGNQAIVADDNELAATDKDPLPNHTYTTVVLFADGSPREFDLIQLRKDGVLGPNQMLIPGPDCPMEELRTLRNDAPISRKKSKPTLPAPHK